MSKNSLATLLVCLLLVCAGGVACFGFLYVKWSRDLRSLQAQASDIGNTQNLARSLAGDVMEYSKTHPDIDPILQSVGLKLKAENPNAIPRTRK